MKYDVFISYSRKDSAIVERFADELGKAGFSVWMDVNGIETGDEFKRNIVTAIKESEVFLFFSSEASNASVWTVKEVNVAVMLQKSIIPIKLDSAMYDDSILFDLAGLDFIVCNDTSNIIHAFEKLSRSLGKKVMPNVKSDFKAKTLYSNGVSAVSEDPVFEVVLKSIGQNKLSVIVAVKKYMGIGLKEAKDLVDSAPCVLASGVPMLKAESLRRVINDTGAEVVVTPAPSTSTVKRNSAFEVVLWKVGPQKLYLVKVIKETLGLGLKEAKNLVDSAPCVLASGVPMLKAETLRRVINDTGAEVVVTPAPSTSTVKRNSAFEVVLWKVGPQKLYLVKVIKETLGLGLKEAKNLVDSAPCVLASGMSKSGVESLKAIIEDTGAKVLVR